MKSFLFFLTLGLSVVASGPLSAQRTWSLEECIPHAQNRNLAIRQMKENRRIYEINLRQARARRLPSLSGSISAGTNRGRNFDQINIRQIEGNVNSMNVGLNANLPIFNGLVLRNTIRQQETLLNSAEEDLMATMEEYSLLIAENYLGILQLHEQMKNMQNQIASSEAQLENIHEKFARGLVAESNIFQMEAQISQEELELVQLTNEWKIAKVTLMQLIDLEVTPDFEIVVPEVVQPDEITLPTGTVDRTYQTSLALRPVIRSAAMQSESARLAVRIARGNLLPDLDLNASLTSRYSSATQLIDYSSYLQEVPIGYLRSDPKEIVLSEERVQQVTTAKYPLWNQIDDNFTPYIGLNLSIPIFVNKTYSSQVQIARINAEITSLQEQNTRNQLRKDIEQAYANYENTSRQYEAAEKQRKYQEIVYDNAGYSFESGLLSSTDFFIEKNKYLNAVNSGILAKYQYLFSRMIVGFYNGQPLGFQQ